MTYPRDGDNSGLVVDLIDDPILTNAHAVQVHLPNQFFYGFVVIKTLCSNADYDRLGMSILFWNALTIHSRTSLAYSNFLAAGAADRREVALAACWPNFHSRASTRSKP